MTLRMTLLTAAATLLLATPAFAQADPHHPETGAPAASQAAPDAKPAAPQAAQPPGGMSMMGGAMMGAASNSGMMTGAMMQQMMSRMMAMQAGDESSNPMAAAMAQHVEGRIGFIKAELAITEAQTPQWNALAEALRADAKQMMSTMPGVMSGASGRATTALDRLDAREKSLTARLESAKRIAGALRPLYAVLTQAQKQKADEILIVMTGM